MILCLKKNNHALYENVLTVISYSHSEWKKRSKYVIIQAANEVHKKKNDSDCHHKEGESVR